MERIRQLRKERDLSQAKLAVMAGMDPATLNRLERGTGNPNLKTLERVADALEVEVVDLFPKGQAPLPLESVPPEQGYAFLTRQLEDWRYLFGQAARQWSREAQSGNLFGSVDSASSYSIAVNIQVVQFFEVIRERLLPTLEELLPEDLARAERRKLLESRGKLEEATQAVNDAALEAVPELLADNREFTEAELAIIDEASKDFAALPELEQRRQMREAWQIVDRIIKEQDEQADNQDTAAG